MKYTVENDLVSIKKQIKEWELRIDAIIQNPNSDFVLSELEDISHEMMAINI